MPCVVHDIVVAEIPSHERGIDGMAFEVNVKRVSSSVQKGFDLQAFALGGLKIAARIR